MTRFIPRSVKISIVLLVLFGGRLFAEERKFAVMLAVPRKSMPATYPGTPLPNPNTIYDEYFDFWKPGVDSFAEYWDEISYGNVHVSGDTLGWVEIPWPVLPAGSPKTIGSTDFKGPRGGEDYTESFQMYPVKNSFVPGLADGWWTPGERFLDLNGNHAFDDGEPFEDFIWIHGQDGIWIPLIPLKDDPAKPETLPPLDEAEVYIRTNYPGDVNAFLDRFGDKKYEGPDMWEEAGNTKMMLRDYEFDTTPEPSWYAAWWTAYWNDMHLAAKITTVPPAPAAPAWSSRIPVMEAFTPASDNTLAGSPRLFLPTVGSYDADKDKDKVIYPDADGYYDGPAEYSDLPSSLYHAQSVSGIDGGGDGRLGEVTSPQNASIHGHDLGAGNPNDPRGLDNLIAPAGPLAFNVHGTNGYDAGNVLNLEYLTWFQSNTGSGGPNDFQTIGSDGLPHPEILKRDYNLDGLLDQGSCRDAGTENYARDASPGGTADGNPFSENYPFNRRRLVEDVVEALDEAVDFDDLTTTVLNSDCVFGTVLLPSGICPPGLAPGGRGLFELPAPDMVWTVQTRDAAALPLRFSDFVTAINGGTGGGSAPADFRKGALCHEFLHTWEGYPDFYDYDVYSGGYLNNPVGVWDIMSGGGYQPAPVLKEKGSLGVIPHAPWLEVSDLTEYLRPYEPKTITVTDYAFNPTGSAWSFENPLNPGERFYFWRLTNVQPPAPFVNFSKYLPGDGLMIMHTDLQSNPEGLPLQNRLGTHFTYNIVQADGLQELENGESGGDMNDPWPGGLNVEKWNANTDPNSRWWSGAPSGLSITAIEESADDTYSMVTFLWEPHLVSELNFLRPPGGRVVGNNFMLKYEAFDRWGGTTIEFYADSDAQGYDGVALSPSVKKTVVGPMTQEFAVPISSLPADGNIYFYARLVPGTGVDGKTEPSCSKVRSSTMNRGHGSIVSQAGEPDVVTVDVSKSKVEIWSVTCADDSVPGSELWDVQGSTSGVLPQQAKTDELFTSDDAGISFRIEWTGIAGSGEVSNISGEYVLEDPTAGFVASNFKANDTVRILSGPQPGLYVVRGVLSSTRLRLATDPGTGSVSYRLHSFKAEGPLGPPDRFTFMTTGKTAYSRPIRIEHGKIVREMYPTIKTAFNDEVGNPTHRAPVTVVFDASDSRDELGNLNEGLTYLWDFGDGTTSDQKVTTHTYSKPFPAGVVVTLTVTNPNPYDDPMDPVPPPAFLAGTATTRLPVPPLADNLQVVFEQDPVRVPEGGVAELRVKLNAAPPQDVDLVASVEPGGKGKISVAAPGSVTFTDANWNTWQVIVLTASQDDDASNHESLVRCSADGLADQFVTAVEQDDDVQAIKVDRNKITVPEGGTAEFGVILAAEPDDPVTVEITLDPGNSHISLGTVSTLTFTPSNWNAFQRVKLVAGDDLDASNRVAKVTLKSAGLTDVLVDATEADNDAQAIICDRLMVSVLEGGGADLQVRLAAEPDSDVTVAATRTSGDTDLNIKSGAVLMFTSANWNTSQAVSFQASEDADAANGTAIYRFDSSVSSPPISVLVVEQDNDSLGIAVLNSPVTVPEGGTAQLSIALTAQPVANTQVHVERSAGDVHITVEGSSTLTFTPSNWNVPQNVTLAAGEDSDASNHSATLRCSAPGLPDAQAKAIEQDNDVQTIIADQSRISVPEEGRVSLRIRLSAPPDSNLTVTTARSSGDADIFVESGWNLTFTPTNWNSYQLLTIAAGRDSDRLNGQAVIQCSAAGASACNIEVTEVDNTPLMIVLDRNSLVVPEGTAGAIGVRLNAEPDANLTVTVERVEGDASLNAVPAQLQFTRQNWNTPQMLSVTAAEDPDGSNGSAFFRCVAPNAYQASFTVSEQDNDSQQILVETTSLTVPEGGTAQVRVKLAIQPDADVRISASAGSGDPDIQVTTPDLTFTKVNWNTWQYVKIAAAEDLDAGNGSNTVVLRSGSLAEVSITAAEQDNDRQLILCGSEVVVPENASVSLAVTLQAQPIDDVTVSVEMVSGDSDLAITKGQTLVFTASNWHINHIVTIAAGEDDDKVDGEAVLRLSSPGIENQTVRCSERDNDPNVAPTARSGSITVAHASAQVIRLDAEDTDQYPSELIFTMVDAPDHGQITQFNSRTGELIYTPDAQYAGADSFTFKAGDGMKESAAARVSITVQAAPTPPGGEEPPPDDGEEPPPDNQNPGGSDTNSPTPDQRGDTTDDPDPVVTAPMACGAGLMTALPMIFAGLAWPRIVRRRSTEYLDR